MRVPAVRTGGANQAAWARSRAAALANAFQARGLPLELALRAAVAVLPHLARETGWGRAEWWHDVGNVKCAGYWLCQTLPDGSSYRAYLTLGGGVGDYVRLLGSPRYRGALAYLLATGDGRGWYDRLMRAGWHPWSAGALAEYDAIARRLSA